MRIDLRGMTLEHALFQPESRLDSAEKLALLNFLTQEFDLDHFLPLACSNLKVISEFVCQELSSHKIKTDLIYCDLSGHSEFDPFLTENIFGLLSKNSDLLLILHNCLNIDCIYLNAKLFQFVNLPA